MNSHLMIERSKREVRRQQTGNSKPPDFHSKSDTRGLNCSDLILRDFVVCRSAFHHLRFQCCLPHPDSPLY